MSIYIRIREQSKLWGNVLGAFRKYVLDSIRCILSGIKEIMNTSLRFYLIANIDDIYIRLNVSKMIRSDA